MLLKKKVTHLYIMVYNDMKVNAIIRLGSHINYFCTGLLSKAQGHRVCGILSHDWLIMFLCS